MKIVIHLQITRIMYGEERLKTLCGRSRIDIINTKSIESGQNSTNSIKNVTCKYC